MGRYGRFGLFLWVLLFVLCLPVSAAVIAAELDLPLGMATHTDGRKPVEELYRAYTSLLAEGWQLDIITQSQPAGKRLRLAGHRVALTDAAAQPAGFYRASTVRNRPARMRSPPSIDDIAALGERRAVVLLPLINPQGYVNNWRYLNVQEYSETIDGHSVGDSEHLLTDPETRMPRCRRPIQP